MTWLERVVDRKDADGRFAAPEAKAPNDKGRRFSPIYRVSLVTTSGWRNRVYLNVGNFLPGVATWNETPSP